MGHRAEMAADQIPVFACEMTLHDDDANDVDDDCGCMNQAMKHFIKEFVRHVHFVIMLVSH